jgi:hypothetical protein
LNVEGLEGRVLLSGNPTYYTVNSLGDAGTSTGPTSGDIRYVVNKANADLNTDGSVIRFAPALFAGPRDIVLTSTIVLDELAGPMVIDGPVANTVVIDGNHAVHDGNFLVYPGVTATLSHLVIRDGFGDDGGGIANFGTLTVADCQVTGNSAFSEGGGIDNESNLSITNSLIAGNKTEAGGGIYNRGTLTVSHSNISGNTAGDLGGGGISNHGALKVVDSALFDNRAAGDGGGIANYYGGAVVEIINSTIARNQAWNGGGIENGGGSTLNVINATIANNLALGNGLPPGFGGVPGVGGGLNNEDGSTATLDNTIVALNFALYGGEVPNNIAGSVTPDSAYNLIGIDTGGAGGLTDGGPNHNQVEVANPGLGSLGHNGGFAETIPLLPGSPAIANGNTRLALDITTIQPLTTDARGPGYVRTVNGAVDIGAYEVQPHLIVTTQPPTFVAPGKPFGMTVKVVDAFGNVVSDYQGRVTLSLPWWFDAALGGTTTVAAKNGVAYFTGLTIVRPGVYIIQVSIDPGITTYTSPFVVKS